MHRTEIREVRPSVWISWEKGTGWITEYRHRSLGFYKGCLDCEACDPTTHNSKEQAEKAWEHAI